MCSLSMPAAADAGGAAGAEDLRNVSIIATGSRGDIQPYVAIALALERAGYTTRILTNEDHKPFVESFRLTHVHVFGNAEESLRNDPLIVKSMADGDGTTFLSALAQRAKSDAALVCERFMKEMEANRPDLLLTGTLTEYFECYANVALGLPTLRVVLNAFSREKRAPFGFPSLPFGLHNFLLVRLLGASLVQSWQHFDDALCRLPGGTRVLPRVNLKQWGENAFEPKLPILVCKSESFRPALHPTIHSNFKFVGAAIIEQKHEMKHSSSFGEDDIFNILEEFLSRDVERKPVYMGWGSMMCKSPEHMVLMATEALRESNQRGIILGGWAQLTEQQLFNATEDETLIQYAKDNILFVDRAPHEWLLPRVSAAVHHGGAGTTNASLRAGVPTIITPVFLDQFDQAYLVEQLGVGIGFSKQFQRISTKELADAISTVTDPDRSYRVAAKSVATTLQSESGAQTVVNEVEMHWKENVVTGKWQLVAKELLKSTEPRTNRNKLVALASIGAVVAVVFAVYKMK